MTIRLGTRGSALARWQADWVAARLADVAGAQVEKVVITTRGDRDQSGSISAIGERGVFTKELQRALLAGDVDLVVHSLKDMPTDRVEGLEIVGVPARGPVSDALVSRTGSELATLPEHARVGTGSLRRRAQLLHVRRDLVMCDVRGNVDTRLSKLHDGEYDALVLAEAGLVRLGREAEITQILRADQMLPAVGQGALAIEARSDDTATASTVASLDDGAAHFAALAERSMLAALAGGCLAPIAGWCRQGAPQTWRLDGAVLSATGETRLAASHTVQATTSHADRDRACELGRKVAEELLEQGAGELIAASRKDS